MALPVDDDAPWTGVPVAATVARPLVARVVAPSGGAEEDRTPDLLCARQVLSQLSYGPD